MTDRHARQPPLAGHYAPTVAVAVLALAPNIVLSTAGGYLQKSLTSGSLHVSPTVLQVTDGLSNAGYAFGAVLAAWLVQRLRQRPLFLVTEALFVLCSVLAAAAWSPGAYAVGRVGQGATTGLLLVIALPPLITQFPVERLASTAIAVNIGLFGAVTVGPLVGGAAASGTHWRWLMAGSAVAGGIALLLAFPTLGHRAPFDTDREADPWAFALAAAGCALSFLGVSQLVTRSAGDPMVWLPTAVGIACLLAFIVLQYRRSDPLVPVKALSTSLPVVGTLTAMVAGAAAVSLGQLAAVSLLEVQKVKPLQAGLLFWPQVVGVLLAATLFGRLLHTRWVPVVAMVGLALLVLAGVLYADPRSHATLLVGAAVLGLGAGSTVSPGLFLAAFGVPSKTVGRAFALVELLRSEAAYLIGPVLLYVARHDGSTAHGLAVATWITVALTAVGLVLVVVLYRVSGAPLRPPDLRGWLDGDEQALESPRTAEKVRA
jgi:MFS family permease